MKSSIMVIDFGTSKISCMIADGDSEVCNAQGVGQASYAGFAQGRWLDPEHVADTVFDAVHAAQAMARRRVRDVYIVVPGDYVRVVCGRAAPSQGGERRVPDEDMERLKQSTFGDYRSDRYKVIHRSTAYHTLNARRVDEPSRRMDGMVGYVLADTLFMRDVQAICNELGLHVCAFVASSLGQAMALIPPEDRARMVSLVDVGYFSTQVAIFQGEGMLFHETLPIGGFHISSDLTFGLDVTLDVAEVIKRRHVFGMDYASDEGMRWVVEKDSRVSHFDNALVQQIIESRCEEIADMVQSSLTTSGFRLSERAPVYLSGGGVAMMRGAQPFLGARLNRPVRIVSPNTAAYHSPNHAALAGACGYLLAYAEQPNQRPGFFARLFGLG